MYYHIRNSHSNKLENTDSNLELKSQENQSPTEDPNKGEEDKTTLDLQKYSKFVKTISDGYKCTICGIIKTGQKDACSHIKDEHQCKNCGTIINQPSVKKHEKTCRIYWQFQ